MTSSLVDRSAPLRRFDPEQGEVVMEPESAGAGYWVGCPGVLYEPQRQRFLLTYRQRRPRGVGSERGWRCAIAESTDGLHFSDVWSVTKEEIGTSSMERFSLLPTPDGGYLLYISYVDPSDNRWRVDVLEASEPGAFDVSKAEPVLTAASTGTEGVKDPYALRVGPAVYLIVSFAAPKGFDDEARASAHSTADIYTSGTTTAPTGLATSIDGRDFAWHGEIMPVGDGWDRYQTRLNSVAAVDGGFLGFYDGSADETENYEERCGVAVSFDLRSWQRLTPHEPWISSPHSTGSLRYLDTVHVDSQWWAYYEYVRPDGAHELRRSLLSL